MANSKHAHLRYNILDEYFRKRAYSFEDLLIALNTALEIHYPDERISVRTLREDLKVFRDNINGFAAPLPEKARILKYSDSSFTIADRPLLDYEQYLIDAAQQLLERFENHPKYDRLAEALLKFQEEEQKQKNENINILFYDHNDEYKGIKFLKPIYHAINNKMVLTITYKGFKDKEVTTYEFHPHVLKQYNNRWFVFGFNDAKNIKNWSIPLDERLIDFKKNKQVIYVKSNTDWHRFFNSMVGIVKPLNSTKERVVLRFYNGREEYFKTKPFHPGYDLFFEIDKKNQVWFDTIINRELVQQILSYGQDVQVLEPKILRIEVAKQIKSMNNLYEH
ncbi:WYL domain-containing protein [Aurantibacter crassamenti]|uniref:helix-turn-helix transcriptional regulator n=1 Tax=Aurantibacter crassamenti TaxID=1837375 RepID=UPI00193A4289|nr:WYL domain-containing protein [Aurantibacter crassamenti]MBM1105181.1 WYL domain-containing protein [Aurantibacter crassamenti]